MNTSLHEHYLQDALHEFRKSKRLGEGAMAQLDEREFFHQLDPESNSIAVIIKHMAGNMRSRWTDFLTTDGEKPDRRRDTEFEINGTTARADVMGMWEDGWSLVFAAVEPLRAEDLSREITIRGEAHTVMQAINRQLTHYAYHVGQIVFLAKHFKSSAWKTLSIARGHSETYNSAPRREKETT
jgi:hypothetical protein